MNRKRTSKFKQGIFRPNHPEKYKGTFPILYRSSWEARMMRWCDHNPSILSWGSESVIVPYLNPFTGRISRYFVDFNVTLQDKTGQIKKFLIEIKPYSQTVAPSQNTKNIKTLSRKQAEYVKNLAKWKAAEEFASSKGSNFVVLTEKHLGI